MFFLSVLESLEKSTLIVAVVAFVTGGGLLKLLEVTTRNKKEKEDNIRDDALAFRQLLLDRIEKLEKDYIKNSKEIHILTRDNASLRKEIKYLKEENYNLRKTLK